MNEQLTFFLANEGTPLYLPVFLVNLALAGGLAYVLGWVYRTYGTALSNRDHFSRNFVLLCMTTMLIISVVKSSLALSLGLVGALSIVRFRSAIKEPEELTYLFFCIAIGLGLGANQWQATLVSFALIIPVLIVRGVRSDRRQTQNLIIRITSHTPETLNLDQVISVLDTYCKAIHLKRMDETEAMMEVVFIVHLNQVSDLSGIKKDLRAIDNAVNVSFLDQKQQV